MKKKKKMKKETKSIRMKAHKGSSYEISDLDYKKDEDDIEGKRVRRIL